MATATLSNQPSSLRLGASGAARVREIGPADLRQALSRGWSDFLAMPSHVIFVIVLYPVIGLVLGSLVFGYNAFSLLFPLMSGFALIGPFVAIGLYELSRRRERGLDTSFALAFQAFQGPSSGSILALGCALLAIFAVWIVAAAALYSFLMGSAPTDNILDFARQVLTTPQGWALIVLGNAVGFAFSLVTLAVTAVSFPMLLDRSVDLSTAIGTSVRVVQRNPRTMLLWGVLVASILAAGMVPLFVGLAVALPLLGHASWHLYRSAVEDVE